MEFRKGSTRYLRSFMAIKFIAKFTKMVSNLALGTYFKFKSEGGYRIHYLPPVTYTMEEVGLHICFKTQPIRNTGINFSDKKMSSLIILMYYVAPRRNNIIHTYYGMYVHTLGT